MGRETVLLRSKEMTGRADVSAFLRELADKLDSGQVVLQQGDQAVTLDVPARVELQIKAEEEEKGTRTQLGMQVEFQWYVVDPDSPTGAIKLG